MILADANDPIAQALQGKENFSDSADTLRLGRIPQSALSLEKVPMISDDGEPVYVPKDRLSEAVGAGYTYESPHEESQRLDKEEYGNRPIAATALGVARGVSVGLSDPLFGSFGYKDAIRKIREQNEFQSNLGQFAGAAIPAVLSGGATAEAVAGAEAAAAAEGVGGVVAEKAGESALQAVARYTPAGVTARIGSLAKEYAAKQIAQDTLLKKAIPWAVGGAVEGGIYGAGQGISDVSLSDEPQTPVTIAETLFANAGMGTIVGGGFGFGLGLGSEALSARSNLSKVLKDEGPIANVQTEYEYEMGHSVAEGEATVNGKFNADGKTTFAPTTGTISPVEDPTSTAVKSTLSNSQQSLDSLVAEHEAAKAAGENFELPAAQNVRDAVENLGPKLKNKPTDIDYQMLENAEKRDILKAQLEILPGKERSAYEAHLTRMNREADAGVKDLLSNMGDRPRMELPQSGENLMSEVSDTYKATKKSTGALFNEINQTKIPPKAHIPDLIAKIEESSPHVANALEIGEEGALKVKPFSPKLGISQVEHSAMDKIATDLNSSDLTVRDMQNMREYLRTIVDPANPAATPNINRIRSAMLGHMEQIVEDVNPNVNVRKAFTDYAVNEARLEAFESIIGGKVESFNALYQAAPEKVIGRIFANSNNARVAQELLGKEKFNSLVGDYLQSFVNDATDKITGELSAAKLARSLHGKEAVLKQVGAEDVLKELDSWVTLKKGVIQTKPLNPSGTAKGHLIGSLIKGTKKAVDLKFGEALTEVVGSLQAKLDARAAVNSINRVLKGADVAQVLAEQNTKKISAAFAGFLKASEVIAKKAQNVIVPGTVIAQSDFTQQRKLVTKLAEYQSNPNQLVADVTNNIRGLSKTDPDVASAVSQAATRAIQFLQAKAPKNPIQPGMFQGKNQQDWKPSDQEIMKFNRYVKAVDAPLSIVKDFQHHILSPESVEAVRTVYPDIYRRITKQAMDMFSKPGVTLNGQDRVQLSILLGSPVDSSLGPAFTKSIQDNYRQPGGSPDQGDSQQPKLSAPGLRKMNPASRMMTPMQKVENR